MKSCLVRSAGRFVGMVLMVLLLVGPAIANPLMGGKASTAMPDPVMASGWVSQMFGQIIIWQGQINQQIASVAMAIKQGEGSLWLALALCFAYGMLHALGPGHAKLVIMSYFLGNHANWRHGWMMAFRMAATHVISAMVLVGVLYWVLQKTALQGDADARHLASIGYAMITLVGASMVGRGIWQWHKKQPIGHHCCGHDHGTHDHHQHSHHHDHHELSPRHQHGHGLTVAVAVGLIPCAGPILVMFFTLANDMIGIGMLMAVAMALGMGITVGGLGMLAIASRKFALAMGRKHSDQVAGKLSVVMYWLGGGVILLFGAAMLWASLLGSAAAG